jgi:hypothetical protein
MRGLRGLADQHPVPTDHLLRKTHLPICYVFHFYVFHKGFTLRRLVSGPHLRFRPPWHVRRPVSLAGAARLGGPDVLSLGAGTGAGCMLERGGVGGGGGGGSGESPRAVAGGCRGGGESGPGDEAGSEVGGGGEGEGGPAVELGRDGSLAVRAAGCGLAAVDRRLAHAVDPGLPFEVLR